MKEIDVQTVTDWAEGTLEEWLPGYTEYLEKYGCQLRIRLAAAGVYSVEPHRSPSEARYFRITVSAQELT